MNEELRLIYVLKIGYNSKGEGLYEFIFSKDTSNIDSVKWGWEEMPANGNADPPTNSYIDLVVSLKTDKIDLICLHELNDRRYIDGYYTIHALAYQNIDNDDSDLVYDDEVSIIVFHYGMKLSEVKDILYSRDLIFNETTPDKSTAVEIQKEDEEEEEDEQLML